MSSVTEMQGVSNVNEYQKTQEKSKTTKSSKNTYGNTIGSPELSDKAKEYYAQLKQKYSNMDFILVSKEKKGEAQANAGKYANSERMVVLIDEEKIERMAEDENYRKQYESIIGGATSQLSRLKDSLSSTGANVKGFGMQVKDNGTASFFAVVDQSLAAQKKRIEKNAEKKAEEKKEAKKAAGEKRNEKVKEKRTEEKERQEKAEKSDDTVTITANSIEELIRKINDYVYSGMSDSVMSDAEKQVGQHIDFRG